MNEAGRPRRGAGASHIYNILRRKILDLELAPSRDLDETDLANTFKISRTPLREALNRLASEQLVVISPNRGASVAPLNLTDFPAFIEALSLVQSAINAYAAMNRTDDEMRSIAKAATLVEQSLSCGALVLTDVNRAFHSAIADAANNPHLARFYERLLDENARLAGVCFSYEITGHEAQFRQIVAEHREMVEAIGAGDAPRAERLGHAHAMLFQRRVLDYLTVNDATSVAPVAPAPQ